VLHFAGRRWDSRPPFVESALEIGRAQPESRESNATPAPVASSIAWTKMVLDAPRRHRWFSMAECFPLEDSQVL